MIVTRVKNAKTAKTLVAGLMIAAASARALAEQQPAPVLRLTFADAIASAIARNPTIQGAAAAILRAEGQLQLARAATRLQINGNVTTTTLNTGVEFQGSTVTPQNQVTASLTADQPIVAAAAWARRTQAQDAKTVTELSVEETKRQVAFATADAYLAILAQRRVLEGIVRARDVAKAHFDLAAQLEQRGAGSRLNALRAQQQVSINEGFVEVARLGLYRAQEALGVLVAADEAADAIDEPAFDLPSDAAVAFERPALQMQRTDLRLFNAERQAADRILRDSSKDWWPTLDALFQPSTTYPSQFFLPQNTWRFLLQANVPIFDAGTRLGNRTERQAALDQAAATLANATTQASSQVRAAREAVASGERALASARAAAAQAQQVVDITNISFRAGAATNIEVIDAERVARDADTAVAAAEDQLRRARLELLNALGRFP